MLPLKKQLREIYMQYRKKNLADLPQEYYVVKNQYKTLIAQKKKQPIRKQWNILIDSVLNKDSKVF